VTSSDVNLQVIGLRILNGEQISFTHAFPVPVNHLYNYAWFMAFGVSGVVYWGLIRRRK